MFGSCRQAPMNEPEGRRRVGAVLHCDAAQAPTGVRVDVGVAEVDLLSLSSHKLYGPKGIGALFVSRLMRSKLQPIVYGGGQEGGLKPDSKVYGLASRLTASWMQARVMKAARVSARFS